MARKYSNTAVVTTLENSGGITPTSTSIVLASTSGYPTTFPFTLRLEPDTANEELVNVNSGAGTLANPYVVSRGVDGTTAKSHARYSVVTHGFSARDLSEPQVHMDDDWRHARRPLVSTQISEPPYNVTGSFVNFTSAAWPALTFTAPPSGRIRVTIGAAVSNTNTANSTAWVAYRISGSLTQDAHESNGLSAAGTRVYASRERVYAGLTPNASTTVTPCWNISSGSGSTALIAYGQLIVDLLP